MPIHPFARVEGVQAPSPLLDRATLERLERLAIHWQQSFQGLLGGHNVSRYAGVGHEFLDHRQFHHGDDLRSVNWRAYLRLERLFLKMFRTEPRNPVRLFIDTSESMACGAAPEGPGEPKFSFACRLAAALCYVGLVRLESIVIQPFAGRLGETFRAGGGRHRFAPASHFLSSLSTGGISNFEAAVREFLTRSPSRGLSIVLSDFLDEGEGPRGLQHLADFGQELLLVQLSGPEDDDPPWEGELDMVDAESGETVRLTVDERLIADYSRAYREHCRAIEYTALRNSGRYIHLTTDANLGDTLYGALAGAGSVGLH